MPKLLLKFKNETIEEYILNESPLTIGRTEDNHVCIDNLGVSRNHARVIFVNDEFFVEDLNSQNGTSVNSLPIKRCALRDKDQISIGKQKKHILVFLKNEKQTSEIARRQIIENTQRRKIKSQLPEETLMLGPSKTFTRRRNRILPCLKIIEGSASPQEIFLEKVLLIAGRGNNADIKIEGNYKTDVVFIISNRPTGFFLSPSINTNLLLNNKLITEVVQLKEGYVIQFQDVKIKFIFC